MSPVADTTVTLGLPKGSLEESTLTLFARAGFSFYGSGRSLWLGSNDPRVRPVLLRPQEIPLYVANGSLDCGLSGLDWIVETECEGQIRELADLCYSKRTFRPVRWVLAVSMDSPYETAQDLKKAQGRPLRISTELKHVTENWLAERGIIADVSFSWGATEAKVPQFVDGIVECTETGESLRANRLRILDTVLESTTRLFANKQMYQSDEAKREKLDGIALLLRSALAAETKVCIRLHAPRAQAGVLEGLIPNGAVFSQWQVNGGEVVFEITTDKEDSRDLVPLLARHGASRMSVTSPELCYG